MTAPNNAPLVSTWDLESLASPLPPRRPTINDFNGAVKIDDSRPGYQPDPQTMPSAAEWNLICKLLSAMGAVVPNAVVSITGGATPSVAGFSSASTLVTTDTFTVIHNGTGDVSITWPANTFPSLTTAPTANLNAGASGMIDAVAIANGVQVRTYNASGTATDKSFTVVVR